MRAGLGPNLKIRGLQVVDLSGETDAGFSAPTAYSGHWAQRPYLFSTQRCLGPRVGTGGTEPPPAT